MDFAVQNTILKNVVDNKLKFAVVTPPAIGKKREQLLSDLALICNTTMIDGMSGNNFETSFQTYLGQAKSIVSTKENTIIVKLDETPMEPILGKIEELKAEIKLADKNFVLKKNLEERVAKLSGGVSMIKVGGITPSEIKEKIARVDDAVCAVRAAREEGVVAGGGVALLNCYGLNGIDKVTELSIIAPFKKIISNAGKSEEVKEHGQLYVNYPIGYDVKEFKEVDMFKAGIIDAKKAVKNAFINAVSANINLLMTDSVITLSK
jgi:chaperonin GroEL